MQLPIFLASLANVLAQHAPSGNGGPTNWAKYAKDKLSSFQPNLAQYTPPALAGCPDSVNSCMAGLHTGAGDCLKLMWSRNGGRPSFGGPCDKRNSPVMQAMHDNFFGNSTAWHGAMYSCLQGHWPTSVQRNTPCPSQMMVDEVDRMKEGQYGSPDSPLAQCWAARQEEKDRCLQDTVNSCPKLAACMGMGPQPFVPAEPAGFSSDRSGEWFCHIQNLRLGAKRAGAEYSLAKKQCEMQFRTGP